MFELPWNILHQGLPLPPCGISGDARFLGWAFLGSENASRPPGRSYLEMEIYTRFTGGHPHRCQSYHHAHPDQLPFSPTHLNERGVMVCVGSDALPNWLCIAGRGC
jgi:hypothetical protein